MRAEDSWAARRAALDAEFARQLSQIAAKCDELGLAEQARTTRAWIIPRDSSRLYLFFPTGAESAPSQEAPVNVRFWHEAWMKARRNYAESLFQVAKTSLDGERVRDVFLLLHEVLRHDPAHREARRILALDEPAEPAARPVRTRHPKFQWQPAKHWRVESPHYEIKTDHSPEEGVRLARRLEQLHSAWRQTFAEYWLDEADLRRALDGASLPTGPRRKYAVVLFRDREEYIAQLRGSQPQIELSEGYYATADRVAYFFAGEGSSETTWLHEGTHQIFYEAPMTAPRVGRDFNFWVLEAVALYMESLSSADGYATVGGLDAELLQYARFRALSEDFYLPLAELVPFGRDDLQRHAEIRRLYSQAAGLAHFFLDENDAARRQAFLRYVAAVHQGRDRPETLSQATGSDCLELDRQYREFLNITDDDLAAARPPAAIAMLSLGGTSVTDAGLAHLDRYPHLTWLNLANTRVSDAGMTSVSRLKSLESLYLTGTQVSDAGLMPLHELTRLKMLDVTGSRVTDEGWRRLQQTLPELKPPE
jgi:hypothetical protein